MPFVADFYPKKSLQTRMRKTPATNQLQMIFEKMPLKFVAGQEKTPEKSGVLARHRGFEPLAFGSVAAKIMYFLGFFTTFYDHIMFDNLLLFKPQMGKNTPKMQEKYILYKALS